MGGGMVTFCVSGIIVWWSFRLVTLLQIVAISSVENPKVDIYIHMYIGLQENVMSHYIQYKLWQCRE